MDTAAAAQAQPRAAAAALVSEEKYKLLKRRLREVSERNETLANELNHAKKRLRHLAKEKNMLLERICRHDYYPRPEKRGNYGTDTIQDHQQQRQQQREEEQTNRRRHSLGPVADSPPSPFHSRSTDRRSADGSSPPTFRVDLSVDASSPSTVSDETLNNPSQPIMEIMYQDGRMVPSSRPKRMRRGPVEPKMRRVQPLERDPVTGEYKLPARVGILTVHSLGRVVPLPAYHNDRYIWPPGFKVSRTYLSMVNPNGNTVYTCSVEENGEQGPRFRVVADDCPDRPIVANSATGVWTAIVKKANEIRNRDHSNSASGPDYYGFTHATIAKMIQDLPGADKCKNYIWQEFGEMHQRTAAGVAAAAQKKLTNLEIMGSANKRAPTQSQQQQQQQQQQPQQQQYPSSSPIPTGTAPASVPSLLPPPPPQTSAAAIGAYNDVRVEPPPPEPLVSRPYDPIMVKREPVDHPTLVPLQLQHPPLLHSHSHPPHPHTQPHPHPSSHI